MPIPDKLLENRAIQCLKDIDFSYFNQDNSMNQNNKYASAAFTDLAFHTSFIAKHYEFSYHLYKNNEFQIFYLDKEGNKLDVPIQDIHKEKILMLLNKVKNIVSNKSLFDVNYEDKLVENMQNLNSPFLQLYRNKLQQFSLEEFKNFSDKLIMHKAEFYSKKMNSMLNISFEDNQLYINQTPYLPNIINNAYFLVSPLDLKNDLVIKYQNKEFSYEEFNEHIKNIPLKNKIKP